MISTAIIVLVWETVRSIGRHLMDGIEHELLNRTGHALLDTPGVQSVDRLQLRWICH